MEWKELISGEEEKEYFQKLNEFLDYEYKNHKIYPPREEIYSALNYAPLDDVKVLILGQDPYHGAGQGHGLSFSVNTGVKIPKSLINIYKELQFDLGIERPKEGYLGSWAKQGVLLLNTVLTVREKMPNSHKGQGWELFTDQIIRQVNEKQTPVVFILWGEFAKTKIKMIDTDKHLIITSSHPSPFSAHKGFFNSRPFSRTNIFLKETGQRGIDWGSILN